ncbi:MAG: hypothetical protein WCS65_16710 [Verrucomicrobiae bacterium]
MADAAEFLHFETALLLLVAGGLLVLAKMFSDLRAEVRSLREARCGSAPASLGAASPASAASASSNASLASAASPAADDGIPPEIFAVIASAVYFSIGESHRIVSVSPAASLAWSREGRRSIFRSHSFR